MQIKIGSILLLLGGVKANFAKASPARRKVRRIVTRSGQGVRGHFPSSKAVGRAQFESLVEEDALRVFEVAPQVVEFQTQPKVLQLSDGHEEFGYTPDAWVRLLGLAQPHYVEVKSANFRFRPKVLSRLNRVHQGMRAAGLPWLIVTDDDLRGGALQMELKELLRVRPVASRQRSDLDHNQWDPTSGVEPDADTAARWERAKSQCDQLLARVMRRDQDDFLSIK